VTTASDTYARLPDAVNDVFGADATAAHAYDLLTVDVPAASWTAALETARDALGCTYFDWLSAVDEPGTGFRVCAHVAALGGGTVRRLLLRTTVPHEAPTLPTAVGVYAGAAWHERETHEMFGIGFEDHPHLVPLLLPESFEGHPLRKDFVLAARVAKAWPGAKEPGESEHGGPKRRTMLPPGVPDPNEWGPLKGQLPPAPARPARGARTAGDRPARRARSASEGSAAQRPVTPPDAAGAPDAAETPQAARPRRARSASQGSASQTTGPAPTPLAGTTDPGDAARATGAAGSADAPWHDARPAFDDAPKQPAPERPAPPEPQQSESAPPEPEAEAEPGPQPAPAPEPERSPEPRPEAERSSEPEESEASAKDAPARGPDSTPGPEADSGPAPENSGPEPDPAPDSSSGTDRTAGPDRPDRTAGGDTA